MASKPLVPIESQLENIRDLKRQTWSITNYGLLLYGAFFTMCKDARVKSVFIDVSPLVLFTIAAIGTILLLAVQRDLGRARLGVSDGHDSRAYYRGVEFLAALILTLWGGAYLVWFSLPYF